MFEYNYSPKEIAEKIYELNSDMDLNDYKDIKEIEIQQLESAIYDIKTMAENKYNKDYWRTLYKALECLCE